MVNDFNFIHRCRKLRLIKSLFVFHNAFDLEAGEYTFNAKSLKSLTVFEKECACMHVWASVRYVGASLCPFLPSFVLPLLSPSS